MEQLSLRVTNTSEVAAAVKELKRKLPQMLQFIEGTQNISKLTTTGNKDNKEYLYSVNVSVSTSLNVL